MIKRVNFTGRRKIARKRVQIEVFDGKPRPFRAAIDLDGIDLLPQAAVFLEATCAGSSIIQRYAFGEVGNIRPEDDCLLTDLEANSVFFTLKVVDRTKRFGRLLGIAENIRPEQAGSPSAAGRRGILGVVEKDLGQKLWELEFGNEVTLVVNSTVPGLIDRAQNDPTFYAVIYPEVVRVVLHAAIEENIDIEEEDDRWSHRWLRFGKATHPSRTLPPKSDDPKDDRDDWVDEVVSEFCKSQQLADRYRNSLTNGNGGEL